MNQMTKIIAFSLAFIFFGSNFHIVETENFTKVGDYSICATDCDHNEHSSQDHDCDKCNNKLRQALITYTEKSFIQNNNNLFSESICIIRSDNSFSFFLSRAPPSKIS